MTPEVVEAVRPIACDMADDLLASLDRSIDIRHLVEVAIITGMAYMEVQAKAQFEEMVEASSIEANRRDLRRPRRRRWAA